MGVGRAFHVGLSTVEVSLRRRLNKWVRDDWLMASGLVVPALLAPRRLLLLTDGSLLVLREVTPLEQLLHVMLFPLSPAAPPHRQLRRRAETPLCGLRTRRRPRTAPRRPRRHALPRGRR